MYLSIIGIVVLSSCATQYRNYQGFGGSDFRGEKTTNNQTKNAPLISSNSLVLDTVISEFTNLELKNSSVFSDSQVLNITATRNCKNQQSYHANEQYQEKRGVKKSLKKIVKHMAKLSFYFGLIGLISSKLVVFSVLAILLGILAKTIYFDIRIKFWAYLGIILGVLGLISPALNAILAILILVALILILMKLMHWY